MDNGVLRFYRNRILVGNDINIHMLQRQKALIPAVAMKEKGTRVMLLSFTVESSKKCRTVPLSVYESEPEEDAD